MGKRMKGIFLMILCLTMSCSGSWNREMAGKNGKYYLYIDDGKSMEINYVSYSVVIRGKGMEEEGKEEVMVVRVVRK